MTPDPAEHAPQICTRTVCTCLHTHTMYFYQISYMYLPCMCSSSFAFSSTGLCLIPSLKRPPLREKVSLQEELAIETAPELPVLETVASQKVQEEKKDSYQLRQAMTQLSQWTPKLNEVSRGHPYVSCSCLYAH